MVADSRTVEGEIDRPVRQCDKFAVLQIERCPLFCSARQDADGLHVVFGGTRAGLYANIGSTAAPTANAQSATLSHVPVISRAHSDCALRRLITQDLRPPLLAILTKPAGDGLNHAFTRGGGGEESTVEKDGIRADHR